ncbi:MAG: PEP-CTERM sorting domain-containing protein [Psychromonas sp.]
MVASSTNYSFSTTFDLTGYDKDSAKITGAWGVDNYASIFLNGSNTGVSLSFGVDAFNPLSDFSIEYFFTDGINTLTVEVTNGYDTNLSRDPGPMALRFDDLELTATAVPAPGSLALLGLCLLGFDVSRRKQS